MSEYIAHSSNIIYDLTHLEAKSVFDENYQKIENLILNKFCEI